MEFIFIAIIGLACIAAIAQPLLSKRKYLYYLEEMFELGDERQSRYLQQKKETILNNLQELDFDHEMGKFSNEDYEHLRQGYLVEAQNVVLAEDKLKVAQEIEQLIEGDVQARRRIK